MRGRTKLMKQNALNFSVLITLLIGYVVVISSPGLVSAGAFQDSGAVSFINLALICLGLGMCLFLAMDHARLERMSWFLLACVYCVYLMREADFHTGFSGESLTKLDTYSTTQVPFGIRLTGAVVLLVMAGVLIFLLARYLLPIIKGILSGQNWGIAFLFWFILLFCSQVFDRKISTSGTHWKLTAVEELLEMSAAIFAVLAIGQLAAAQKHN
jgi:hypothetical protein